METSCICAFHFRNSKKSVEQIKTMELDVEDMETRLKQMKQERLEIEEDAKKLLKCVEEIELQLAEGDEAFTGNQNIKCFILYLFPKIMFYCRHKKRSR